MNKFLILILLSFVFQTDWLKETKMLISEIDKKAIIVDTKEIEDKDGIFTKKEYKSKECKKTYVKLVHSQSINIEFNFYEQDGFMFGKTMNGKSVLIYKSKRLETEPYATLFESKTYFKNKTEGINLTRKINIYESDNIEDLKEKLKKMEFEKKILNADNYENSRKQFEQMITKNAN